MITVSVALLALLAPVLGAADTEPLAVRGFLTRHCVECHGPDKQKAHLRLDTLETDLSKAEARRHWVAVAEQLRDGTMPPARKPRPDRQDQTAVLRWIDGALAAVDAEQRTREGRSLLRRLSRSEYVNTLHDLLDIKTDLTELLPEDASSHGFENVDLALTLSPVLLERYLAAADVALDAAIVQGPRPVTTTRRFPFKETKRMKILIGEGSLVGQTEDAAILYNGVYTAYEVVELFGSKPGTYRFKVSVSGHNSGTKPVLLRIYIGNFTPGQGKSHFVGFFEALPNKPTVIEILDRLETPGDTIKIVPYGTLDPWKKIAEHKGPGVAVHWLEVEGPLNDSWPPPGHRRLFGNVDLVHGTAADAEKLLRAFLPHAFRRPVRPEEVRGYTDLVNARMKAGQSFPDAMRVAYKAVLCSPNFLFLQLKPGKLDDYALATRLSYFLWCSLPDERLVERAHSGTLAQPEVLRAEVERMLADPKAQRFTEAFTGQWLGLRTIDATAPDRQLYPEYDELLRDSMPRETQQFFAEILRNDRSLLEFVDSDWAMLNARLAHHYGIKGVEGVAIHKVALPKGTHRGGVLTQASVLKVTANGTNTSPVIRGNWVLDKLLGKPAPPPPPGVAAVEPDIRGATTIRDQLARHRTVETCASCHARIDPPGFALEHFDVIGGWRDRYRIKPPPGSRADLLTLEINGGRRWVPVGARVDASAVMPDGTKVAGIDDLKKWLLKDPDTVVLALIDKMVTTATGHAPEPGDRVIMNEILNRLRTKTMGLRSLIHEVVQSPLFLNK